MYHVLYGNLRPWSAIPTIVAYQKDLSFYSEIEHREQGIKQTYNLL